MIIGEPYQRDGRTLLRNIQRADSVPPGYVDTGLANLPGPEAGKLVWDGSQVVPFVQTDSEKLDRLGLPPRLLAALVVGALPPQDTTPGERAWARAILLDARDRARAVLSGTQSVRPSV